MKIIPLAADSLGTRSMATFISTKDCKILIDPSAALAPKRYGLEPHKKEKSRLKKHLKEIAKYAKKADILIVTHYHHDHYDIGRPELFKGKIAYLKHPTKNINKSQKKRAKDFIEKLDDLPKEINYSEGKTRKIRDTKIKFSNAMHHGTSNKLGYVTEVMIDDGKKRFIYTSDIQGPVDKKQTDFILNNKPDIIYLDGALSYMLGFRFSYKDLNKAVKNMVKLVEKSKAKKIIVDHHLLRDLKWKERLAKVFEKADAKKVKIMTAAEYRHKKNDMLEANRKKLWKKA